MAVVQRLEAAGVIVFVLAGMLSGAAATLGLIPMPSAQIVAAPAAMLAAVKGAAILCGLVAYRRGRVRA